MPNLERQVIPESLSEDLFTCQLFFDIHKIIHTITEYTFFSNLHRIFTKTNHIWAPKIYFNTFKKKTVHKHILSDHNGIRVEIDSRIIAEKNHNLESKQHTTIPYTLQKMKTCDKSNTFS
jgi:hypothetical protein